MFRSMCLFVQLTTPHLIRCYRWAAFRQVVVDTDKSVAERVNYRSSGQQGRWSLSSPDITMAHPHVAEWDEWSVGEDMRSDHLPVIVHVHCYVEVTKNRKTQLRWRQQGVDWKVYGHLGDKPAGRQTSGGQSNWATANWATHFGQLGDNIGRVIKNVNVGKIFEIIKLKS